MGGVGGGPGNESCRGGLVQGDHPLLASLAGDDDVGGSSGAEVGSLEADEFPDADPRGDHQQQPRVVALSAPGVAVGGGQQGVDFGVIEVDDLGLAGRLGRDGQDSGDERGVFGVAERGVGEQGVDGGQSGVAGGDTGAALGFERVQEP